MANGVLFIPDELKAPVEPPLVIYGPAHACRDIKVYSLGCEGRPVRDALPIFTSPRGTIRFSQPASRD